MSSLPLVFCPPSLPPSHPPSLPLSLPPSFSPSFSSSVPPSLSLSLLQLGMILQRLTQITPDGYLPLLREMKVEYASHRQWNFRQL